MQKFTSNIGFNSFLQIIVVGYTNGDGVKTAMGGREREEGGGGVA